MGCKHTINYTKRILKVNTFCIANGDTKRIMTEMNERLIEARKAKGYSNAADACRAFGWNVVTYRSHENGIRGYKSSVEKYAKAFGVSVEWLITGKGASLPEGAIPIKGFASLPVLGNVQAGTFIMVDDNQTPMSDLLHISVPLVEGFDADKHYLLKVIGDSMNKRIPDGYYAICVEINGKSPKIGDIVVVERLKDGGQLVETTIKRLSEVNGRRALVPESYDPKFTTIYPDKEINGTEIRVVAVVVNAIAGGF